MLSPRRVVLRSTSPDVDPAVALPVVVAQLGEALAAAVEPCAVAFEKVAAKHRADLVAATKPYREVVEVTLRESMARARRAVVVIARSRRPIRVRVECRPERRSPHGRRIRGRARSRSPGRERAEPEPPLARRLAVVRAALVVYVLAALVFEVVR